MTTMRVRRCERAFTLADMDLALANWQANSESLSRGGRVGQPGNPGGLSRRVRADRGHVTVSVPKATGDGFDRHYQSELQAKARGKGKADKSSGANPNRPPPHLYDPYRARDGNAASSGAAAHGGDALPHAAPAEAAAAVPSTSSRLLAASAKRPPTAKRMPTTPAAPGANERLVRPRIAWQPTSDVRLLQAERPWRQNIRINRDGGMQYWNTCADDDVHIDVHDQEFLLTPDASGGMTERYWLSWILNGDWHWRTGYY